MGTFNRIVALPRVGAATSAEQSIAFPGTTLGVTMGTAEIVPGWYSDPMVPGHIRYWDGTGWTAHSAAPLPTAPATAYFATANMAIPVPSPLGAPRAPRRRLPLPAIFVLGTALIGFPLAIGIGVLAAHASAPPPLETPVPAEASESAAGPTKDAPTTAEIPVPAENPADAAAKTDAAALRSAIIRYYQQTNAATPPVLTVSNGKFVFASVPYGGKTWTWPPIDVSDGVSLKGQNGDSMDTWCVWVHAAAGTVGDWQVTNDGVSAGTCGLG